MRNMKSLLKQAEILAVERRPEACFGCEFEHSCSTHGCAVIKTLIETERKLNNEDDDFEKYISEYARICEDAVNTWGNQKQIQMAVEEMSELTKALLKFLRYGDTKGIMDAIAEERADVQIMLNQLNVIFGTCNEQEKQKLARLDARIKSARGSIR